MFRPFPGEEIAAALKNAKVIACMGRNDYIKGIWHLVKAFSLVEKKENSGGAVSSQIGISKAVGKYLALVDSDDIVANGAYGLLISRIEKDGSDFAAGLPIKLNSSCRLVIPEIELPIYSSNRVLESDEEIIEFALQPFYWNIV